MNNVMSIGTRIHYQYHITYLKNLEDEFYVD